MLLPREVVPESVCIVVVIALSRSTRSRRRSVRNGTINETRDIDGVDDYYEQIFTDLVLRGGTRPDKTVQKVTNGSINWQTLQRAR